MARMPLAAAVLATIALASGLLSLPGQAAAGGAFSPETGTICRMQTATVERERDLPRHLLLAISLAESGRWHAAREESFPWPWTVTAGGGSRYFETKEDAIRAVERLQANGTRNIDVGCMQINLHYHPDAFASLEEAFDPAANVAYAARFLDALQHETRSWKAAIGRYHSATPHRADSYLAKVERLWQGERMRIAAERREAVKQAYRERQAAAAAAREERAGG